MAYIFRRDEETYITNDRQAAEKLSRGNYFSDRAVNLDEVLDYFAIGHPGEVEFSPHPTFNTALRVSNTTKFNEYVKKAIKVSKLPEFDEERVAWEDERERIRKQKR